MGYQFEADEHPDAGVRRIVRERIDDAMKQLDRTGAKQHKGIHEGRKRCKEIRAVLRLARRPLGVHYRGETADTLLMPVIPSHLSLRAYDEVVRELDRLGIYRRSLYPYFSLVDRRRAIHRQWLAQPPESLVNVLQSWVPAAVDNERMGEHRAPVGAFAPRSRAARAWRALWQELEFRLHMSPPAQPAEGTG